MARLQDILRGRGWSVIYINNCGPTIDAPGWRDTHLNTKVQKYKWNYRDSHVWCDKYYTTECEYYAEYSIIRSSQNPTDCIICKNKQVLLVQTPNPGS